MLVDIFAQHLHANQYLNNNDSFDFLYVIVHSLLKMLSFLCPINQKFESKCWSITRIPLWCSINFSFSSTVIVVPFFIKSCFHLELLHGLAQIGRTAEAENEFEKLLGGSHFKSAINELSKSDRGDEVDTVKFSELLCGRHFKGMLIDFMLLFAHYHVFLVVTSFLES